MNHRTKLLGSYSSCVYTGPVSTDWSTPIKRNTLFIMNIFNITIVSSQFSFPHLGTLGDSCVHLHVVCQRKRNRSQSLSLFSHTHPTCLLGVRFIENLFKLVVVINIFLLLLSS